MLMNCTLCGAIVASWGSELYASSHIHIWIGHTHIWIRQYGKMLYMWASMKFLPSWGSVLTSGSSGLGGDIVCVLGLSQCLPPPRSVKWVPVDLMLVGKPMMTSVPSWGSRNIPSCFMLLRPDIRTGLLGHLLSMQTYLL